MEYLKSNEFFANLEDANAHACIARPWLIADNLRTPENLGSLIRLADNIGAGHMIFLGENTFKAGRIRYAAASSINNVSWSFSTSGDIRSLIPEGYTLVALETASGATNLFETRLPERMAVIVGSERNGISPEVLKQADIAVFIPVPGPTRSLNVSHAASVLLFEWLRQMTTR